MKQNLVKKLALTLALTSTLSLASCKNVDDFVANLSADGKIDIKYCLWVVPENSTKDYYVSFICHYDNGVDLKYIDHKDYRLTYKITKEEYTEVSKLNLNFDMASRTEIETILKLIKTYDPVEVKMVNNVSDSKIHDDFKEEYRFNEEEYLNNLE